MTMKNFLTYVLLTTFVFYKIDAICIPTRLKFAVKIENALPHNTTDQLKFNCKSGDTDLGYHALNVGQSYEWSFCANFFGKTLYFCNFQWGTKHQSFDVFSKSTPKDCPHGVCKWVAMLDGFYSSNPNYYGYLEKVHDWL
ncbi:hypothetical protein CASFOL_021243 [Castilleja foliolosa]|uniref:S-protein homolog n=1 Tax=Castilleja foliolosa TaxID=1961234 RepID=A0ABD3CYM8_9LAMI